MKDHRAFRELRCGPRVVEEAVWEGNRLESSQELGWLRS